MASRFRAISSGDQSSAIKLRLVLIGNQAVGKSSFISKFVDDAFVHDLMSTIGIDFKTKTISVSNRSVELNVWDTAGQERFWSVTPAYCRNADGIILVYDTTNLKSFEAITFWLGKIDQYAPSNVDIMLIGSKCDLKSERVVTSDIGTEVARRIKAPFFEVSAQTGENIEKAFEVFARTILDKQNFFAGIDRNHRESVIGLSDTGTEVGVRRNSLSSCCGRSPSSSSSSSSSSS